ncbi:MAG: pyridoxamine 5'-phosphate oxidase family protein [bacterium]|nr:pyridoxamine 5'-phosphate oxidase family protein [bacterium]
MQADESDKKALLDYLGSQRLMSVATYGKNPWIATVYYVVDDGLNFYFFSDPKTQHGQDIAQNDKVVCSIADSSQKVTDKKVGVQLWGRCRVVESLEKIKWLFRKWHENNPGVESFLNLENMKKGAIKAKAYRVVPKKIKFFNEKLYGPEGQKIFVL